MDGWRIMVVIVVMDDEKEQGEYSLVGDDVKMTELQTHITWHVWMMWMESRTKFVLVLFYSAVFLRGIINPSQ